MGLRRAQVAQRRDAAALGPPHLGHARGSVTAAISVAVSETTGTTPAWSSLLARPSVGDSLTIECLLSVVATGVLRDDSGGSVLRE